MLATARPEAALRVVGRYRVYREIASGGMATVHLGHMGGEAGFSRVVAIKRMKPEIARQPEFVTMFRDEAAIAARVQHANVVATLDVVSEGDELFIVMEYVRGLALKQLMQIAFDRGDRVPVDIALSIIGGALEGLHAAHNVRGERDQPLDLVHRDISPHNILVGRDGLAKIVDFGVAKAASRMHQTAANEVKGKLTYMAPERITHKDVDRRVDIFSMGVVLWEVLAGRKRYDGSSVQEIASKLLTTDAPLLALERSDVPGALDDVIRRATARAPADRYPTAEAMLTDLERIGNFATKRAVSAWLEETGREPLREHEALTRSLQEHLSNESDAPNSEITLENEPFLDPEPVFDDEPELPLKTEVTRIFPELSEPTREPPKAPATPAARPMVVATVPMQAVAGQPENLRTQVMAHPMLAQQRRVGAPAEAKQASQDDELEMAPTTVLLHPKMRSSTHAIEAAPRVEDATPEKRAPIVAILLAALLLLAATIVLLLRAGAP
jgi:serine/threonine protein kinase